MKRKYILELWLQFAQSLPPNYPLNARNALKIAFYYGFKAHMQVLPYAILKEIGREPTEEEITSIHLGLREEIMEELERNDTNRPN